MKRSAELGFNFRDKIKFMKVLERNIQIRKTSLKEETDDLKNTTPAERWAMMWQLALDAWAFKGETLAEPGLQIHLIRIYRRES